MSTTFPAPLAAHAALASTTFADLLRITRTDSQVYAFTSSDIDIIIDGITYVAAPGLQIASLSTSAGNAVDNSELTTLDDGSTFTRADVLAGRWHGATYWIGRCNWAAPADGTYPVQAGVIGEVRLNNGYIVAEMRALQQYLQQPVGAVTSKTCRARLGDAACGVDVGPFTQTGSLTSVTSKQVFTDSSIGGDGLYSSVSLLLHGNGAHNGTTFTDNSSHAHALTVGAGTPVTSTTWSQFGGASMYFDGSSRLVTPTNAVFGFPGDLTFEFWLRPTVTGTQYPLTFGGDPNAANGGAVILYLGSISLYLAASPVITGPAYAANTTYHVAVTRSGTTWRLFVNGVLYGPYTSAINLSQNYMTIGGRASGFGLTGYIDDLRITKGAARYTAAFSVPDAAYPDIGYQYDDEWFSGGVFTFTSGANAGLSQKVKSYTSDGTFTLSLPMILPVAESDTYSAIAGCRKRHAEDCVAKFANGRRFQGEPDVPGLDAMMSPPR